MVAVFAFAARDAVIARAALKLFKIYAAVKIFLDLDSCGMDGLIEAFFVEDFANSERVGNTGTYENLVY